MGCREGLGVGRVGCNIGCRLRDSAVQGGVQSGLQGCVGWSAGLCRVGHREM